MSALSAAAAGLTFVRVETTNHIATLTLHRPERRNALNRAAHGELECVFRAAADDTDVRCIILTGADPAFCSGDDVAETFSGPNAFGSGSSTSPDLQAMPSALAALACPTPIIAAVNGAAVGWGMELALFADIRIASERARFGELFVKRGLVCDIGGLHRLPALVGIEKAASLLYTGEVIDAAEAHRIRLVTEIVPHDQLLSRANVLAGQIAANPPLAVRRLKEGLSRFTYGDPREIGAWTLRACHELAQTEDHREGVASFLEKRAPVFRGR